MILSTTTFMNNGDFVEWQRREQKEIQKVDFHWVSLPNGSWQSIICVVYILEK